MLIEIHRSEKAGKRREILSETLMISDHPLRKLILPSIKILLNKRGDTMKSLDTRINGQNILQISKQKSFYYKDEEGNVVILSDDKKSHVGRGQTRASNKHKITNLRNNGVDNKGVENTNKINTSDFYYNMKTDNQSNPTEKQLFRRKTTRPVKSRRLKKQKIGTESMRNQNLEIEKRDHSLPTQHNDLGRQKTFDSKLMKVQKTLPSHNK